MKDFGLILSGGGSKGIAHTVFLEYFEKNNLQPSIISGTSAGALVGAFFAAGYSVETIRDFFKASPLFRIAWLTTSKPGLFDTTQYKKLIEQYLPATFEELKTPLIVTTTNIELGTIKRFESGPLRDIVLASCAIPMLFSPIKIEDSLYVDGAVLDNLPVEPLLNKSILKIGSYLGWPAQVDEKAVNTTWKVASRANHLLLHSANQHKIDLMDFCVSFPLGDFSAISKNDHSKILERATNTMQNRSPLLDKLLH